jgi:hypothetical protein
MQPGDWDYKEVLAQRVRNNISDGNGEELIAALSAAEAYLSDQKELVFDAFMAAGDFQINQLDYYNSILYYNKARKYRSFAVLPFDNIIRSATGLYTTNKEEFIKVDLLRLIPAFQMLCDYYSALPNSGDATQKAEDLLSRMAYRATYVAKDSVEGKMTYRSCVISDALEKDVPMEQVKKEVGKLIADLIKKAKRDAAQKDSSAKP